MDNRLKKNGEFEGEDMDDESDIIWREEVQKFLSGGTVKNELFHSGGKGSGYHGHSGRPGQVGGSQDGGSGKTVRVSLYGGDAAEYTMPKYVYHVTSKTAAESISRNGFSGGRKNYFTSAPENMMNFDEEIIGRLDNEDTYLVKIDTGKIQNSSGWKFDQEWYPSASSPSDIIADIESGNNDLYIWTSNSLPRNAIAEVSLYRAKKK